MYSGDPPSTVWLGTTLILRRKIPLELGNLANLAHLFVSDNRLSGYMPTSLLGRLNMDSSDLCGLRFCRGSVSSARSATSAAHRGRAMLAQVRGLLERTPILGAAGLGQSALLPPRRNAAHTPHSGNRRPRPGELRRPGDAVPEALLHDRGVENPTRVRSTRSTWL